MKKIVRRVIKSFKVMADAIFLKFSQTVTESMANAAEVYPAPVPALKEINEAIDIYSTCLTAAATRDKVAVAKKNEAKAQVVLLLSQLCNYVNTTTTNVAQLEMTGFQLNKVPEPIKLAAPEALRLTDGKNSGELRLFFPGVKGAYSYLFQVSTDPAFAHQSVESVPCTTCSYTFQGLKKGVTYYCRAISVGGKGQMMYSIIINRVSQ